MSAKTGSNLANVQQCLPKLGKHWPGFVEFGAQGLTYYACRLTRSLVLAIKPQVPRTEPMPQKQRPSIRIVRGRLAVCRGRLGRPTGNVHDSVARLHFDEVRHRVHALPLDLPMPAVDDHLKTRHQVDPHEERHPLVDDGRLYYAARPSVAVEADGTEHDAEGPGSATNGGSLWVNDLEMLLEIPTGTLQNLVRTVGDLPVRAAVPLLDGCGTTAAKRADP